MIHVICGAKYTPWKAVVMQKYIYVYISISISLFQYVSGKFSLENCFYRKNSIQNGLFLRTMKWKMGKLIIFVWTTVGKHQNSVRAESGRKGNFQLFRYIHCFYFSEKRKLISEAEMKQCTSERRKIKNIIH